jgi:flagellar basal-body rod protein FlgF
MSDGIYSALSGALAQERTLAVVANNVANATTPGFQADRVVFGEIVAQTQAASPAPSAQRYVNIDRIGIDARTGGMEQTGSSYDVALQGEGYLAVETPAGERYTRAGSFVADGDGVLRTHSGLRVLAEAATPTLPGTEISIPSGTKNVSISPDGTVQADGQSLGKLKIVRFEGDDPLRKEGLTLLAPQNGAQPLAAEDTTVAQGFLETSNVNAVSGMQELITVSRSFDAFQKVIETFRDIDQRTARDVAGKA